MTTDANRTLALPWVVFDARKLVGGIVAVAALESEASRIAELLPHYDYSNNSLAVQSGDWCPR